MRIHLDDATMAYIRALAVERDEFKQREVGPNNWMRSNIDPIQLRVMQGASEWAAAVGLGCMFNPYHHHSGDGDRGDLTCNGIEISLKARNFWCAPDYIIPDNAKHQAFLDKFGVVAKFTNKAYNCLDLIGWFNADDFAMKKQLIEVGGTRNGVPKTRLAICGPDLRPIGELIDYLDGQVDKRVVTAQTEGYLTYFRAREAELRAASESAHPTRRRNQTSAGSKCQATIGDRIRAKGEALRGSAK